MGTQDVRRRGTVSLLGWLIIPPFGQGVEHHSHDVHPSIEGQARSHLETTLIARGRSTIGGPTVKMLTIDCSAQP